MKKIFLIIFAIGFIFTGCVDDYTDANPPAKVDGPGLILSTSSATANVAVVNASEANAYVLYGEPVEFTVTIVDAPGKIGAISVTSSIEEFGTVEVDEAAVAALQGKESGEFTFTFTPNTELVGTEDRVLALEVLVSDSQLDKKGEEDPITAVIAVTTTLTTGCFSAGIEPGTYYVSEAAGNRDGSVIYDQTSLNDSIANGYAFSGGVPIIVVTKKRDGVYKFAEVTGGVWPIYYPTRATPAVLLDLCESTITGRPGFTTVGTSSANFRQFTVDGTVNTDGTISITWSYVRVGGATPAGPAKGSYTLTRAF